ncbi:hypothetical protein CYMTET_26908 [Cymbomonas tetramitiformis]|uniref:Uncharacterized protein n=1 Tax=Cymbomonas tetramitiformis TaxID=36881 RepID=A0AAE0KXG2_9CHLO|nr:hypothetical protein CYMTET_26908 [Cymbomonas tetramitiformis]
MPAVLHVILKRHDVIATTGTTQVEIPFLRTSLDMIVAGRSSIGRLKAKAPEVFATTRMLYATVQVAADNIATHCDSTVNLADDDVAMGASLDGSLRWKELLKSEDPSSRLRRNFSRTRERPMQVAAHDADAVLRPDEWEW